jgi:arginyl-tRNA synthetase
MNVQRYLEERVAEALAAAGAPAGSAAVVMPSGRPEFGDYQANGAMAAAKKAGRPPRELAAKAAEKLDGRGSVAVVEVAGPGFVNLTLDDGWIAARATELLFDPRLGVPAAEPPERVVVDYSGPNLAKEMHVGHLRSTIIGDALARILSFLGHDVVRQNHVGDWGTQFGMLIAHLEDVEREGGGKGSPGGGAPPAGGGGKGALADLEAFYVEAKRRFDAEEGFADRARERVVRLQSGDPAVVARWRSFLEISLSHCEEVYRRLGVLLSREDVRGESAYNDDLPRVAADLSASGVAVEDQGALCVFLPELAGKDGKAPAAIVRKGDGGYLYMTSDLASLRYRASVLRAGRILYVVDARQAFHFQQLFAVARKAGFAPERLALVHVPFGTVMGPGGQPLKTRDGGTPKLSALLDEAEGRAFAVVSEKNPDLPEGERREIARAVGVGAVKYADLSKSRASDYVFDYDEMLSLDGNTAPYLLYAFTRVSAIFRRGGVAEEGFAETIRVREPAERRLALHLLRYAETVHLSARELAPHVVCAYLYELAGLFMSFYEACPVLKAEGEGERESRLALCLLTARTIAHGLSLLGIGTLGRM